MKIHLRTWFIGLGILAYFAPIAATAAENAPRDIVYVDNKAGSDDFTGRAPKPGADKAGPFATIMKAITQCQPGARIEIANTGTDYRETVRVTGLKKSSADAPLLIDGHGAYVSGLVSVPTNQWIHLKDDIYYFLNKVGEANGKPVYGPMPNSNWLAPLKHQGWFTEKEAPEIFFLNGKPGPNALKLEASRKEKAGGMRCRHAP